MPPGRLLPRRGRRGAAIAVRSRDPSRRQAFEQWAKDQGVTLARAAECEVMINATPLASIRDHLPRRG